MTRFAPADGAFYLYADVSGLTRDSSAFCRQLLAETGVAVTPGRDFDPKLLGELPAGVDPCGERGEFHTFARAGPMFRREIEIARGEVVQRDGFVFADLLEGSSALD